MIGMLFAKDRLNIFRLLMKHTELVEQWLNVKKVVITEPPTEPIIWVEWTSC